MRWRRIVTHLEDEPPSQVDTAHRFGTIRKAGVEWNLSIPVRNGQSDRKCSKEGCDR